MLAASAPNNLPLAFAASAGAGYIRAIPTASQIGVQPGAASLTDGFVPLNMTPVNAGGVPPFGQDMNGILNWVSAGVQWKQYGGNPVYNSTFSTAIGGYPNGAVLQSADGTGWWRSTADNNTNNPDTGGANWLPHFFYGLANITLTGSNVTLSATQYAKSLLVLSGTLTANVQLIFPAGIVGEWTILNNCTMGAYSITAITSGGTGVALTSGAQSTCSDGTNTYSANPAVVIPTTDNGVQDFRLTLTTGLPVTTSDVTGAGTLYACPYKGNRIALYSGTSWSAYTTAQFSLALSALTSGLPYDVFAYSNAGVPTLELAAWTNATTRATGLVYQDGVLVKSGATTRRYLGTIVATGAATAEDSIKNRFVWNYYNRVMRSNPTSFTTTRTVASAGTYVEINSEIESNFVLGVSEDSVFASANGTVNNGTAQAAGISTAIAFDSTSAAQNGLESCVGGPAGYDFNLAVSGFVENLAIGKHFATLLASVNVGTSSYYSATSLGAGQAKTVLITGVLA